MRRILAALACLLFASAANAAPVFPALTGRVVDAAHILSPQTIQTLEVSLATHERATTNQVVVVTIPTLEGSIEEYGVALGRKWGIGQKGKDNGVLLIVSPTTHDVRIEVGYGLEGNLTDALSSQIIQQIIVPNFKAGSMDKGVLEGTQAIISLLEGKEVALLHTPPAGTLPDGVENIIMLALLGLVVILCIVSRTFRKAIFYMLIFGGRGGGGRGGSGGGFSGGGGRFGGGGSSGKW